MRFPNWTKTWTKCTAGELGNSKGGYGFPIDYQGKKTGIPFFKVSDMNNPGNESWLLNANHYLSPEGCRAIKAKPFESESIVFAKVGAALMLDRKRLCHPPFLVDNNMMVFTLTETHKADLLFVYFYFLRTKLANLSREGALPSLNAGDIDKLPFFIPTMEEQLHIASFLRLIERRIEAQNKIIEEREASIKSLFLSLDIGMKQEVRLRDIGEYRACDSLSWGEIGDTGQPAIIYGELFTSYRYLIDAVRSHTIQNLRSISTGHDLLFPSSTTVDAVSLIAPAALLKPGVRLGGDMFSIVVKDDIDPVYLSFLINCRYKTALSKYAQGSTIIHLHYGDISSFAMKLVSFERQKEISAVMGSYISLIENEKRKLSLLRKQKEFLLQNMFI